MKGNKDCITPIDISCHVKDDKPYAIQHSHSTKYAVFLLSRQLVKIPFATLNQGYTVFTAYIYLTVYTGILQRSLQNELKVGTVLLWSWQIHV